MPLLSHLALRPILSWERLSLGMLLLLALLVSGSCHPKPDSPLPVFGSPDSPRLRQVVAGLRSGLAPRRLELVTVPEFAPPDDETLHRIRAQHPPLLLVLGSPALLRVAPVEKRVPVVFAMVGNPYVTGVAPGPAHPDIHQKNITGIASPPPVSAALEQGARLLGPGSWGLLYDPQEGQAVEVAQLFTKLAPAYGLTPLTEASSEAATDLPALEKLLSRGARVLYLPPTASAARYAPLVLTWGRERRVKVVSSHPEVEHQGAILWVALDYRTLGKEAASLAQRVLAGERPENIPIMEKMPLQVEADESLLRYWSGYPGVPGNRK
jgi:ABC-type uncharacterized transport system substrate-binding protein